MAFMLLKRIPLEITPVAENNRYLQTKKRKIPSFIITFEKEGEHNMTQFEGTFDGQGMKVGIVVARFNEFITVKLLSGAQDNLIRHGVKRRRH